uniref:non-specific serine/threonine protein kinase n=1 Tax=Salix viminalis TaxID=40686 RepID=A0A6N2LRK1_SALVM
MNAERLFLYSLLLILHFISCASKDSINTTKIIRDGDVLISKGNSFALGFFSPGKSSNRYLGIWVLSFDEYGNLILYSDASRNVSVWSTNVSGEEADTSVAKLLDSGNFVVVQESGNILWQSFDYPTHYVLPGMKLGLDLKKGLDRFLTSWRSADDPGIGDYSYRVNPSGSPQIFLYKGEKRVWRTSPWPWRPQRRLLVDYSGFVKAVKWHESDGQWRETWRAPRSKCDSYGWCGPYSTCEPTDANKFECSCLPGFEPRNPSDWMLRNGSTGCVRKRLESSSVCRSGEGFLKVEIVFLPDTSAAVWLDMDMSHADCERECKRNCSCSAYARVDIPDKGTGCLTWYGDLVDAVRYC